MGTGDGLSLTCKIAFSIERERERVKEIFQGECFFFCSERMDSKERNIWCDPSLVSSSQQIFSICLQLHLKTICKLCCNCSYWLTVDYIVKSVSAFVIYPKTILENVKSYTWSLYLISVVIFINGHHRLPSKSWLGWQGWSRLEQNDKNITNFHVQVNCIYGLALWGSLGPTSLFNSFHFVLPPWSVSPQFYTHLTFTRHCIEFQKIYDESTITL